ncbi:MAG: ferritin family protein [Desulfobacteraceae bacterium]|nr:ferritin family protein [Desulfobacteraceae bacterium]
MSYSFNAGEVFKIAIQIEENGKRFYEQSQRLFENAGVKSLFSDLARQEVEHKAKFESLKAQLPPEATTSTVWDPDNELDQYIKMMADGHVFVSGKDLEERLATIKNTKDALNLAIEFEKDSVLFFLSLEDVAGAKDQELIKSLVKEEQAHLKRLTLELVRLKK